MSNFFFFDEDIEIVQYPFDPSRPFYFHAFGGSSWFYISGYAYPDTRVEFDTDFIIPVGEYEVSLNMGLKGREDVLCFCDERRNVLCYLSEQKQKVIIQEETRIKLVIQFNSSIHYLKGDNYEAKEDYGKDYFININVVSGGQYERKKEIAVLKGDLNEDGLISTEDLVNMRLYLLGAEFENAGDMERYDINGDGKIDAVDLLALRQYLSALYPLTDINFREEPEQ